MQVLTKHRVLEVLFLFIISLFLLFWFTPGHMVLGADSGYPIDFITYFHQRLFTWFSSQNFGVDYTPVIGQLSLIGVPAFVASLGIAITSVQKITFVLWFFLMNLSMYFLAFYIFPEKKQWKARLIACIIYTYNFYLLPFLWQGAQTTFSAYIFFPLFTLILLSFLQKKASLIFSAISLNLVYFVFNGGAVHGVPLLGPPIVLFFVFCLVFYCIHPRRDRFLLIRNVLMFIIASCALGVVLNAYWLIPFLLQFQERFNAGVNAVNGIEGTVGWAKMISDHASFLNLSRLQGDRAWYTTPDFYSLIFLRNPLLIFISFLFAFLSYGSYFFARSKKERLLVTLFIVLSVAGFFFAMGVRDPLGQIYALLMQYFPGFIAFRSPYYKFTPLIIMSTAILVAFSLQKISEKLTVWQSRIFMLGVVVVLIGYHFPYFQKENLIFIKPYSTMVKVPSYIHEFAAYKNATGGDGRILVLPPLNKGFSIPVAYTWKYLGFYPLFSGLTEHSFVFNHADLTDEEKIPINHLYEALRTKKFDDFLNMAARLGVTHILLTKDTAYNNTIAPSENPLIFSKILSDSHFIKKWERGQWIYYEIINQQPHARIRATDVVSLLKGNFSDLDMGIWKDNNFVVEEQVPKNILRNLSIGESFTELPCLNCTTFQESGEVAIPVVPVPPLQVLYNLKLQREKKLKDKGNELGQQLDYYLGLSIKRLGEIRSLQLQKKIIPLLQPDLSTPIALLYNNVVMINTLLAHMPEDSQHINEYSRAYEYQRAILQEVSILLEENKPEFQKDRTKLFAIQNELKKTEKYFNSFWQLVANRQLVFALPRRVQGETLTIPLSSLPKKSDHTPIIPTIIDQGGLPVASQQSEKYVTFLPMSSSSSISLAFPDIPNRVSLQSQNKIIIGGGYKNCLSGSIINYEWNSSYLLSTNFASNPESASIYVDLLGDKKKSDDISPDMSYGFAKDEYRARKFYSTSNPTDSAMIYFCTETTLDPRKIFIQPKVEEVFTPQLFLHTQQQEKEQSVISIDYKRFNPTSYQVHVKNAQIPFVLLFTDRYSPLWKATIGKKTLDHFTMNGYANGWYVDTKGEFDISLTFTSQRIFEGASVVSLIGVIATLASVFYYVRKKYHT